MWTVSKLARECGLSRTAVLYYESIGLLKPARRGAGNYRVFAEHDAACLRRIRAWRDAGLSLADIRGILQRPQSGMTAILQRRLAELDAEIEAKRNHQRAILLLLQGADTVQKEKKMTKEKWTEIMRAAGLSDEDMRRWHCEFERAAPRDHGQFLEYLHIPPEEARRIREWSGKP